MVDNSIESRSVGALAHLGRKDLSNQQAGELSHPLTRPFVWAAGDVPGQRFVLSTQMLDLSQELSQHVRAVAGGDSDVDLHTCEFPDNAVPNRVCILPDSVKFKWICTQD